MILDTEDPEITALAVVAVRKDGQVVQALHGANWTSAILALGTLEVLRVKLAALAESFEPGAREPGESPEPSRVPLPEDDGPPVLICGG